jgi:hypothetical protein
MFVISGEFTLFYATLSKGTVVHIRFVKESKQDRKHAVKQYIEPRPQNQYLTQSSRQLHRAVNNLAA